MIWFRVGIETDGDTTSPVGIEHIRTPFTVRALSNEDGDCLVGVPDDTETIPLSWGPQMTPSAARARYTQARGKGPPSGIGL